MNSISELHKHHIRCPLTTPAPFTPSSPRKCEPRARVPLRWLRCHMARALISAIADYTCLPSIVTRPHIVEYGCEYRWRHLRTPTIKPPNATEPSSNLQNHSNTTNKNKKTSKADLCKKTVIIDGGLRCTDEPAQDSVRWSHEHRNNARISLFCVPYSRTTWCWWWCQQQQQQPTCRTRSV